MIYKKLIKENKQEVLDWFYKKDEEHRRKMTPYHMRRIIGRRIIAIERGRDLEDFDIRWIQKFGVKSFVKKFY